MAEELTSWKGSPVVPLDENAPLYKGDRIVIRFKWFLGGGGTYLKSAQLAIIDKKLANRSDFVIRSFVDQGEFLDAEIEVLASPPKESVSPDSGITQASLVVSTGVIVCVALISATIISVTYSILYVKAYRLKLVESGVLPPPSQTSWREVAGGLHVLVYVAGILVVLFVFRNLLGNSRGQNVSKNQDVYS